MMNFTAWNLYTKEIRTFFAYDSKSRTDLNKTVVSKYFLVIFVLLLVLDVMKLKISSHVENLHIHFESACLCEHIRKYLAIFIFM